jgi:hypothetical protein
VCVCICVAHDEGVHARAHVCARAPWLEQISG